MLVEVDVAPKRLCVVVDCADQRPVFDIKVFELETFLAPLQLVEDCFLEAHSLVVESGCHSVEVAFVAKVVVESPSLLIRVEVHLNIIVRFSTLDHQVESNIFEI